jgi:hypothetical protein
MLLLITGASAVGKTTVRLRLQSALPPNVEAAELCTLVPIPPAPTLAWRQEAVEQIVRHAVALQADGRHLLLSGDPIPPGEVVAAPSFDLLNGFAACLLDVQPDAHRERLKRRGDDETLWDRHLLFVEWLRAHHRDPQHLPIVIQQDGWSEMRWDRWADWQSGDARWRFASIDTTGLAPEAVADAALAWCREVLAAK